VDEARVRELLLALRNPDGTPLVAEDAITGVTIAPGWVAVALTDAPVSQAVLRRVHAHLAAALPDHEIELRCGGRVFRGGDGFGVGRHVLAVLGGKGGVGKSTVAVSLSLTLSAMGFRVGVLDGDLNGPDIPHLLGVHPKKDRQTGRWPRERVNAIRPPQGRRKPYQRWGLEVMSVGFMVPERAPLAATGRWLVSSLLRNLIFDVGWTADVVIIDAPPGTGEEIQVMVRELPLSGAVFVTTPQDLAQMDAERTLAHLREHNVPVIGMVQNMASPRLSTCTAHQRASKKPACACSAASPSIRACRLPPIGASRWCSAIRVDRWRTSLRASARLSDAGSPTATRSCSTPPPRKALA
jgi:ATP-binding protein involved in chromosome partitioning